jgi:hypothetical protein
LLGKVKILSARIEKLTQDVLTLVKCIQGSNPDSCFAIGQANAGSSNSYLFMMSSSAFLTLLLTAVGPPKIVSDSTPVSSRYVAAPPGTSS